MNNTDGLPEFQVEISSPGSKYRIEPVLDQIKTLEGVRAGLPYGGSSGRWGDSGKGWTEQYGTPIGADITYYSPYENVFYRLDIDFPLDTIKDYMERAYSVWDDQYGETVEYKRLGRGHRAYNSEPKTSYDSFTTLVFGFAPKGMVVVWLNFGNTRIELGRYQAKVMTNKEEIAKAKEAYTKRYRGTVEEMYKIIKELGGYPINDSSLQWDNYRLRYSWRPVVISDNSRFELMEIMNEYYNGEKENMLRPWVANPETRKRAIPKEMYVFWQTGKEDSERLQANIFFNWEETNEAIKKAGDKIDMQIKISKDNKEVSVFLNNQPLKTDSIRIFGWVDSMSKGTWFKGIN